MHSPKKTGTHTATNRSAKDNKRKLASGGGGGGGGGGGSKTNIGFDVVVGETQVSAPASQMPDDVYADVPEIYVQLAELQSGSSLAGSALSGGEPGELSHGAAAGDNAGPSPDPEQAVARQHDGGDEAAVESVVIESYDDSCDCDADVPAAENSSLPTASGDNGPSAEPAASGQTQLLAEEIDATHAEDPAELHMLTSVEPHEILLDNGESLAAPALDSCESVAAPTLEDGESLAAPALEDGESSGYAALPPTQLHMTPTVQLDENPLGDGGLPECATRTADPVTAGWATKADPDSVWHCDYPDAVPPRTPLSDLAPPVYEAYPGMSSTPAAAATTTAKAGATTAATDASTTLRASPLSASWATADYAEAPGQWRLEASEEPPGQWNLETSKGFLLKQRPAGCCRFGPCQVLFPLGVPMWPSAGRAAPKPLS